MAMSNIKKPPVIKRPALNHRPAGPEHYLTTGGPPANLATHDNQKLYYDGHLDDLNVFDSIRPTQEKVIMNPRLKTLAEKRKEAIDEWRHKMETSSKPPPPDHEHRTNKYSNQLERGSSSTTKAAIFNRYYHTTDPNALAAVPGFSDSISNSESETGFPLDNDDEVKIIDPKPESRLHNLFEYRKKFLKEQEKNGPHGDNSLTSSSFDLNSSEDYDFLLWNNSKKETKAEATIPQAVDATSNGFVESSSHGGSSSSAAAHTSPEKESSASQAADREPELEKSESHPIPYNGKKVSALVAERILNGNGIRWNFHDGSDRMNPLEQHIVAGTEHIPISRFLQRIPPPVPRTVDELAKVTKKTKLPWRVKF